MKSERCWDRMRTLALTTYVFLLVMAMFLIAFGAEMYHIIVHYKPFMDTNYVILTICLMVDGILLLISSIITYYGAKNFKGTVLKVGTILLAVLLLLNIAIIINGFMVATDVNKNTSDNMLELLGQYGSDEDVTNSWDLVQEEYFCCGAKYPDDWSSLHKQFDGEEVLYRNETIRIPKSCCVYYDCSKDVECLVGCIGPITDYVTKCFWFITYFPFGVVSLGALSIALSATLAVRMKHIDTGEDVQPILS